jgi:hypothetical protein
MQATDRTAARRVLVSSFLGAALAGMAPVVAQCATPWVTAGALPGAGTGLGGGSVKTMVQWDPDGAGPAQPVVVVGGSFTVAGTVFAGGIALYDPVAATWSSLGSGIGGGGAIEVLALTVRPNGDLVAGGLFWTMDGVAANCIARWDGSSWSPLGAGILGPVRSLHTMPNGDLIAGGDFSTAGGSTIYKVARWDGANWSPLGAGLDPFTTVVNAVTTLPNGDLIVGGDLSFFFGQNPLGNIVRWDGSTWSMLGSGLTIPVHCLFVQPNGELVAGTNGGVRRWNGVTWSSVGTLSGSVRSLVPMPNGDLVAAGDSLVTQNVARNGITRWDGTSWTALGSGLDPAGVPLPRSLVVVPNGDLLVGGSFAMAGGVPVSRMARWNGTNWSPPNAGFSETVVAVAELPNGDIVAGGHFTSAAGVPAQRIARRSGTSWSPMGTGMNSWVNALQTMSNGDLVAAGRFTTAGGTLVNRIARWNGTTWSAMGTGMDSTPNAAEVYALARTPNGDLIAAGDFYRAGGVHVANIARWNGTNWSGVGIGLGFVVRALAVLPNGDIVVGGQHLTNGNVVQRWNGATWSTLGSGLGVDVRALAVLPNGDIVASGSGGPSAAVQRWDGISWSSMNAPVGAVFALAVLPDGDLIAGGRTRWDGASWSPPVAVVGNFVLGLTQTANGDVLACGDFDAFGGVVSARIARLTTTCPASATALGSGCPSSGGSNTLVATTLPWVDATFRATGTGLPSLALVVAATSFTAIPQGVLPLASVFAQAPPGCDLLVAPDILQAYVTTTGIVESSFLLPSTPPIVGLMFHHQMVPFELDAQSNVIAITATNAVQLTAGQF